MTIDPLDPAGIDLVLTEEERAVRETVRDWCADRVLPHVADWFENGELPVEWPGAYEARARLVRGEAMSWHQEGL